MELLGIGFVLLFYTHSLPCGNGTPQLAWLRVTTQEFEITFVSFDVDFRNQTLSIQHLSISICYFDDKTQLCPFQKKS